ncbi:MAG TPA: Fe-S cluster assembly protein SufD [Gemmataceae bacterium]|nr:Fe-S cluster assembly protein SufD [Gemmataceae bacterium]
MDTGSFTRLFAEFDRGEITPTFASLRQSARARFASLGWPTAHSEDWRFTNVTPIIETPFVLPPAPNTDREHLPGLPHPGTVRLVFINGQFASWLSTLHRAPRGLQVGSLVNANPDVAPKSLGQIADFKDNVFTALNTSFVSDGAIVAVQSGTVVEQPIEIIYLSQPGGQPFAVHPRTLIVVGHDAQATVVERYLSAGEGLPSPSGRRAGGEGIFTNAVTEIVLMENANVDHVKVQQENAQSFHVANTQIVQAARSVFTSHYLGLGGGLVRNEVRVRFDGEHCESTINGLYLGVGKQHLDNFTVIDHAKPNCASHELYKGILDDKSHGVFNGKIFVRKDAQKTDAKQTNKVLLLSDDATINTKPQLEIFADDVKCTHGATIGQLDATQLFYLQSRGIPLDAARRLLTFAFANDIVHRLKMESLREELEARIVR